MTNGRSASEVLALLRQPPTEALPSGDVTFVFTDLEGSTRLLHALGDSYASYLAVHRSLIGTAMDKAGVVLVSAEGDEMFFAASSASAAIEGALAAQAALHAHVWPDGYEFRVRIGMHTGHAVPIGHSYVALAVHQAARVMAAGHGGQVLMTAATASLAQHRGRELGRFRLKDFEEPVALVQLDGGEHPPLKVPPEAVRRIPLPTTSFVGRSSELDQLRQLGATARLITITGPGGVGKTRVALEHAAAAPNDVTVAVAELAATRTASEVVGAVAAAFELEQKPDVTVRDQLGQYLDNAGDVVLVLDNCEQVVDFAADLVDALLREAPTLRVVATSREPLGLPEEQVLRLSPFGVPVPGTGLDDLLATDAPRLLVDRILARDARFIVDQRDAEHVVTICQHLDGSPLGLELIAGHVAAAGLAAARVSLESGDGVSSSRGRPERHRSVGATLRWSYDLLTPDERLTWERLSVFVAPFRLDAAADVASYEPLTANAVRQCVISLVTKSVITRVVAADGDRYRMHQTVREFGLERLGETERRVLFDRHAEWAHAFLRSNWLRPTPTGWSLQFAGNRDDLVAAWHHRQETQRLDEAAAHGVVAAYFDCYQGRRYREAVELLRLLADGPETPSTPQVLITLAGVTSISDPHEAQEILDRLEEFDLDETNARFADAFRYEVALGRGDLATMERLAHEHARNPADGSWMGPAMALGELYYVEVLSDHLQTAQDTCSRALAEAQRLEAVHLIAAFRYELAFCQALLNPDEQTMSTARQAAVECEEHSPGSPSATFFARMLPAALQGPDGASTVVQELRELHATGVPIDRVYLKDLLAALRLSELTTAWPVALGAVRALTQSFVQPIPLYERLLGEAEIEGRRRLGDERFDQLFRLGFETPTYSTIITSLEQ